MTIERDGMEHVRMLADQIGCRPTGSPGERAAAEYLCEQLRRWGLTEVAAEPFPALGWEYSACALESDATGPLPVLPVEYSGSTPAGGVQGELVVCENPAELDDAALRGRILLTLGTLPPAERLLKSGVLGLLLASPERARPWHHIYGPQQPLAGRLPMVTLGFSDAVQLLRRQARSVRLAVQTQIREVTGLNVVGAWPGAGPRRVNVSAHYDSVPTGPAAADNATGAACALEVVRSLIEQPSEVTVDIALFSGEEIGLYGAAAYAQAHAEALAATQIGIYFDGQGDFLGRSHVHVLGQPELADLVRQVNQQLGYTAHVQHHFTGLDQVFLSACGVPTLWYQRGPQLTWHSPQDIAADVSPQAMQEVIAAAAALLRRVIAHPEDLPRGIPAEMVQRITEYTAQGAPCW